MALSERLTRAQEILGHEFNDKVLLRSALTHPSAVEGQPVSASYERLEFLGDSILGAVVARSLFESYPEFDEGKLTRLKVSLVSGKSLSRVAYDEGIADCIIFGESEAGTDKRGLPSALENVYESLVAALYLDGGMDAAYEWVSRSLLTHADRSLASVPESPKSSLQELLQDEGRQPHYRITGFDGPPHDRTFHAQVLVDDEVIGEGSGKSKKRAEAAAAQVALDGFEKKRA